jgi:rhodanese-related sulfurtransferase
LSLARRFVREAGLIAGLAVILGLAVNVPLVKRFFKGDFEKGFLAAKTFPGIIQISLAEAEDLFARGEGLFVDARTAGEYADGHIAGAVSLPFVNVDDQALDEFKAKLLPGKKFVVYCSGGDCLTSLALARRLTERGMTELRVFLGGWVEWKAAGLPEERGQ